MPRIERPLDPDDPVENFAEQLRGLRDRAVGRPREDWLNGSERGVGWARGLTPAEVADRFGVSRSSIYSALAAEHLPAPPTLEAMVRAWSPLGVDELPDWMRRRRAASLGVIAEQEEASVEVKHAQFDRWLGGRTDNRKKLLWDLADHFRDYYSATPKTSDLIALETYTDESLIRELWSYENRWTPSEATFVALARSVEMPDYILHLCLYIIRRLNTLPVDEA